MGLASKLAAASAAANAVQGMSSGPGGYPQQQPPKPGAYPGAASYTPYPGAQQHNAQAYQSQSSAYPPQGSQQYGSQPYGSQPPGGQYWGGPQGQQYGAQIPPADPREIASYKGVLQSVIRDKGLESFIPMNDPRLDAIAAKAPSQVAQVCQRWNVPKEIGADVVKLALFDIIIYIDNSGSMRFDENGERIDDLALILNRVAYAATLFDEDGISLRFMNNNPNSYGNIRIDHIKTEGEILSLIGTAKEEGKVKFQGMTPLGTELRNQVIDPLIIQKAHSRQMTKPILVITITDGQPTGESRDTLEKHVSYAINEMKQFPQYGRSPISFEFAQVGNDMKAREFLAELDASKTVGHFIDCTSNYENEQDEMMRKTGQTLTPDAWIVKLLLGAIDSSYDTSDEHKGSRPVPGHYGAHAPTPGYPPQGAGYQGQQPYIPHQQGYNYNQQSQQSFGQPQQSPYGHPPSHGYNQGPTQNYGYGQQPPPQQSYGQPPPQNYGAPPQPTYGQSPQGGYPPQGFNQGAPQQQGFPQGGYQQYQGPPPRY